MEVFLNGYNLVHSSVPNRQQVRAEFGPLTSCLFKELQGLGVHLPSAPGLWAQGLPLHQVQVGSKLHEQTHKGRLAAVTQDGIHDAPGGAPAETLRVDRPVAVEVRVRPCLEQKLEALEVVVGCTDIQRADNQGGEAPGKGRPDVRKNVVVDVDVGPVPTGETQG